MMLNIGMATPDGPHEGHIADTGMFRRFVDQEQHLEQAESSAGSRRWALLAVLVALVVVAAIVVWLLVR